uniref:Apple domain-containing protein n=1 Tax=Acrobeloides nanus TaxID=290746 RepID=A0A914E2Y8_9BILA
MDLEFWGSTFNNRRRHLTGSYALLSVGVGLFLAITSFSSGDNRTSIINVLNFLIRAILDLNRVDAKTICTRRQYTLANTVFYQRIEVESAVACVERCIDNIDYCKAPKRNFCQLYGVNSESRSVKIQPEANLDPASTVYEILDKCTSGFSSDDEESQQILKGIRPSLKRRIEQLPGASTDEIVKEKSEEEVTLLINDNLNQPVLYEQARVDGKGSVAGETYSSPLKPENPFTATRTRESEEIYKEQPESEPVPIRPVQVSHNGVPIPSNQYGRACPGGYCPGYRRPNSITRDYPCPARRIGDPCLPRPSCGQPPLPRCELPRLELPRVGERLQLQSYWSSWTMGTCSVTCGIGVRQRKRFCSSSEKNACPGQSTSEEPCELPPCDIWTEWTPWTQCSATCGGGEKSRQRYCRNGQNCVGPTEEHRTCGTTPCPSWSQWSPWECSVTCGEGLAHRSRTCLPAGSDCQGPDMETQPCVKEPCSEWSPWTRWAECSKSCGSGERSRSRECMNGNDCPGPKEEHILCNTMECPSWSEWNSWSGCSATCGDEGTRLRNRECRFEGYPSNDCDGPAQDQSACQLEPCPTWSKWSPWSVCSASCGHGQQMRTRECEPRGFGCAGGDREIRFCQLAVCPYWGEWSEWGGCSVTCGLGSCERRRKCERDAPLPGAVLPSEDELGLTSESSVRESGPLQDDVATNSK